MTQQTRNTEIKHLAELVAEENWNGSFVDLNGILSKKGINLYEDKFDDEFDGVLEFSEGIFSIFLNTELGNNLENERGRFTIGHELGHFFIDEHRRPMENGQLNPHPSKIHNSDLPMEREADLFSSNLLMPEKYFKKLSKNVDGFDGIRKLSDKFRTSITATSIRFVNLSCPNSALIYWNRNQKPSWFVTSENYYLSLFKGKFAQEAPSGSATIDLLQNGTAGESIIRGSILSEWKANKFNWNTNSSILVEEAFCLGQYGVLTLLKPDKQLS